MAKGLIEIAIQLGSKLGANTSKFLGTRSNVSFLGSGRPKDGMLFQQNINPESFATIGIEKVIPDIESSLAYAAGGKLNDIELSTLIKNLKTMDETINPTNVVDMGIDSLRAKSGIGERQLTEAASDIKSIDDAAAGVNAADAADVSPLMSRLENRVQGIRDETEVASGIMETIPKVDLPGKRATSREFLVEALKKENPNQTTFADIVDPVDAKLILEGGGVVVSNLPSTSFILSRLKSGSGSSSTIPLFTAAFLVLILSLVYFLFHAPLIHKDQILKHRLNHRLISF